MCLLLCQVSHVIIRFCVIIYVIVLLSICFERLVLVGSTTQCPCSPERWKFFVLCHSLHYVISVLTVLLWNEIVQATWSFVVSIASTYASIINNFIWLNIQEKKQLNNLMWKTCLKKQNEQRWNCQVTKRKV